jgi:ferrochelatase
MRYGSPSLKKVMEKIHVDGITHLTVLPLYPQFADSTTETIFNRIRKLNKKVKDVHFIRQFYDHPAFINAFVERMKRYNPASFDHVIFTYHSLPESHLQRIHPEYHCTGCACETAMPEYGRECYKAAAYETSRRLASAFQLSTTDYSVSFQSRFANKWIGPFTDERIRELAAKGVKRILVVAPSFVADCLETIVEISLDYKELFLSEGGNELVMAESLNDEDFWATAIVDIIR